MFQAGEKVEYLTLSGEWHKGIIHRICDDGLACIQIGSGYVYVRPSKHSIRLDTTSANTDLAVTKAEALHKALKSSNIINGLIQGRPKGQAKGTTSHMLRIRDNLNEIIWYLTNGAKAELAKQAEEEARTEPAAKLADELQPWDDIDTHGRQ